MIRARCMAVAASLIPLTRKAANSFPMFETFRYSPEVHSALRENKPVVALESTIVAHGMPYPQNIETAQALEAIVRAEGAVPATIAVLDGEVCVGLSEAQLLQLARAEDVMKLSRRDLAWCVSEGRHGATTVAATMMVAERSGIRVFATGGIGGVHRGAETNWDVSADLQELARSEVAVVCAGPKAILDLPATLEYLETLGVPVVAYQCDELPAFYSRRSGLPLELRADRPDALARFLNTRRSLNVAGGVLVVNPIPAEHELPSEEVNAAIERALAEAEQQGLRGKQLTPFLLQRMLELTDGKSLKANRALVENNARLAAQIACAL